MAKRNKFSGLYYNNKEQCTAERVHFDAENDQYTRYKASCKYSAISSMFACVAHTQPITLVKSQCFIVMFCVIILIHISQCHHYCCINNCRQIINCDEFQDDKTAMPVFCSTLIKEYRVHLLDESVIDYEF